jgi:magnesium transporter
LEVAIEHATALVPTATAQEEASAVRGRMLGEEYECAEDVAVLDGTRRLVGVVPIERLIAAPQGVLIESLMDGDPPVVGPDTNQEAVAHRMVERGEASIAVVDAEGRFAGLIPPSRMLAVMLDEHAEDLARIGGYLHGSEMARRAAEEPIGRRLWHRLPWLLIGLAGAMVSVAVVGSFEQELEANVLLAFFLPGVIYMADAVGTQTEAVLIRALSSGVTVRSVLAREMLTGAVLGTLVGVAFLPFAMIAYGDGQVAVAVAVALFASCSIATTVAMLLPWLLQRLGRDPAFGAGPLATVIQDLLSIIVYFAVAVAIVG